MLKFLKIFVGSIALILALMVALPVLFPGKIETEIKKFANEKIDGNLEFKDANLSFFTHFPSLTLSLNEFSLKGAAPYSNEILILADEIGFGINLKNLIFGGEIAINKIFITESLINILVSKNGEANYNVYKSDNQVQSKDSSATKMRLDQIVIENTHFKYNDLSTKILIDANGFNYFGKGDLDKSIFDLKTKAKIDDFNFTFNGEQYLKNKSVNADLITKINTNSLSFVFQENNIKNQ